MHPSLAASATGGLGVPAASPGARDRQSVFLQLHLFLGYFVGQAARDLIETATVPVIVVLLGLVVVAAVFWVARRGRRRGAQALTEAACPLCLVLGAVGERELEREEAKVAAPA